MRRNRPPAAHCQPVSCSMVPAESAGGSPIAPAQETANGEGPAGVSENQNHDARQSGDDLSCPAKSVPPVQPSGPRQQAGSPAQIIPGMNIENLTGTGMDLYDLRKELRSVARSIWPSFALCQSHCRETPPPQGRDRASSTQAIPDPQSLLLPQVKAAWRRQGQSAYPFREPTCCCWNRPGRAVIRRGAWRNP